MNDVYIKAISCYFPEKNIGNKQLIDEFPEWTVDKIFDKVGVESRHVAKEGQTALDMAIEVSKNLFEEYHIDKDSIDFVLLCTQSPDYFLPTSACILQDKIGVSDRAGALDFNLGCSGFVYGLSLAKGLITAQIANNILLVTSETYSKYIHPKDKKNRTIFGDAAAATLISVSGFAKIENFCLGTDGKGAENLIVKTGAMRNPLKKDSVKYNESGDPLSDDFLFMEGSEIFNFTLERVPKMVNDILEKHNKKKEDIDVFVFHQANSFMLNFLRKKLKVPEDKFYINMNYVGNTVSSTIPIALEDLYMAGKIQKNMSILIAGFGVGYSWGATILET